MSRFVTYLTKTKEDELRRTAVALMTPGKGILAADEASSSMKRRFDKIGVENSEENRRVYRELLFTSGRDFADSISGVILQHETLYQRADSGQLLVDVLREQGVIPGINADKGMVPLGGTQNECTTQGLDGLAEKCQQYFKDGTKFAKWRCVYRIDSHAHTPSHLALIENANVLARFASICQQNGIVPMVEPEVSIEGDHDLETCQRSAEQVWSYLYKALADHKVFLEGTILKTSMVIPGKLCRKVYTPQQVAEATVTALRRVVPVAVPGIGFLSGGQSEEEATVNLNAINKFCGAQPWTLTFCYGRALQSSALAAWSGKDANVPAAQKVFTSRAKANGKASLGKFD